MVTQTQHLPFIAAQSLAADDLAKLTDEQLNMCWHSYASYISYLHADDYGDDWKKVPQHKPKFNELAAEIERRGLPKPTGSYLL